MVSRGSNLWSSYDTDVRQFCGTVAQELSFWWPPRRWIYFSKTVFHFDATCCRGFDTDLIWFVPQKSSFHPHFLNRFYFCFNFQNCRIIIRMTRRSPLSWIKCKSDVSYEIISSLENIFFSIITVFVRKEGWKKLTKFPELTAYKKIIVSSYMKDTGARRLIHTITRNKIYTTSNTKISHFLPG